jgi:hypothetical protein
MPSIQPSSVYRVSHCVSSGSLGSLFEVTCRQRKTFLKKRRPPKTRVSWLPRSARGVPSRSTVSEIPPQPQSHLSVTRAVAAWIRRASAAGWSTETRKSSTSRSRGVRGRGISTREAATKRSLRRSPGPVFRNDPEGGALERQRNGSPNQEVWSGSASTHGCRASCVSSAVLSQSLASRERLGRAAAKSVSFFGDPSLDL